MSKAPSFNQKSNEKKPAFGQEPEWDLSAFYKSPDDPQIEKDLQTLDKRADEFKARYEGKIKSLNAQQLLACMKEVDEDSSLTYRLYAYSSLLSAKDQTKFSSFEAKIQERINDMGIKGVFFGVELPKIPMQRMKEMIAEVPALETYRVFLEGTVKMQPHMLGEEAEKALKQKALVGGPAWAKLFGQMEARSTYTYEGKEISQEEVLTLRGNSDRAVREAANKSFHEGLKKNLWLSTFIMNQISLDNATSDEMRRMPGPVSGRNMGNNIDDAIVDAMNKAIVEAYPRVSHRYYELMRKMLDVPKLKGWDRNAPLPGSDVKIPYDEAKEIVLASFRSFSPRTAEIAEMFFDNNWIDARVTPGKSSGAFSHPCSVDTHPVVMLNYLGSPRDVATMAHELGHGIHQYLAAHHLKSEIAANTPLTIAETASIFGEMLTFRSLLAREKDPQARAALLAGKANDMVNTVVRQNAFFNFEKEVHALRKEKKQDLEPEEINAIYLKTQKEALGPAFDLDQDYGLEWSYVSHFIQSPYYVYSYAFGDCLVNSLYRKYEEADDKEAFAQKYTRLLESGGTKSAVELVKEFDLDLTDPSFWDGGMKMIEEIIDQLETEIKAAPKQKPARAAVEKNARK